MQNYVLIQSVIIATLTLFGNSSVFLSDIYILVHFTVDANYGIYAAKKEIVCGGGGGGFSFEQLALRLLHASCQSNILSDHRKGKKKQTNQ